MSDAQKAYFERIHKDVEHIYDIAKQARAKGIDPSTDVECPPALDMAGRVETLVGPQGLADKIRAWKEAGADQDEICFRAMDEVLEGKFPDVPKEELIERAVRVALAIKTEGVVSAPLEGIGKVIVRNNPLGGTPYLSIYFAGPIRAAGGTVQAFAVLCADYVRLKMNIPAWKATKDEIERMVEEVKLYDRIMNLQYPSTNEEIAFATEHLTVELNGEPTEDQEVSAHRDLPRIETNVVRGGPCLVLNDGLLLKSKKILKIIEKRKIPGWEWLGDLKKLGQKQDDKKDDQKDKQLDYGGDNYKGKKERDEDKTHFQVKKENPVERRRKMLDQKNPPLSKFIADIIAGRPVFSYPSRIGGHRLRYGRSRNTGLAACGFHPSQMLILEKFLAIGTQIRIERPGKSGAVMPVTSIEPPIILLDNGDVKQLWDIQEASDIADKRLAKKILFLGDILFGYGEFNENNHVLLPSGYVEEWWALELEDAIKKKRESGINPFQQLPDDLSDSLLLAMIQNPFDNIPTGRQSLEISSIFSIGIHPRYLDHWGNINGEDLIKLRHAFQHGLSNLLHMAPNVPDCSQISWKDLEIKLTNGLLIPNTPEVKHILELAFIIHTCQPDWLCLDPNRALIFIEIFGFGSTLTPEFKLDAFLNAVTDLTALESFPLITSLKVPDKAPYYIGSRMGRPEKAKERKMRPPVQLLFPVGQESELQRSFQAASSQASIEIEICSKKCNACGKGTILNLCPNCGKHTEFMRNCRTCGKMFPVDNKDCPNCHVPLYSYSTKKLSLKTYFDMAAAKINKKIPNIKGVKGLSSEFKVPEPIEKGILRALNDVWVYKDGTIRVDAIDIPLTHFNCKEINVTVEKIIELGYTVDIYGNPITSDTQIIELKVQDILLTHHLADYFLHVANFVDDELEYIYDLPRFYNMTKKEDLIGHIFAGLAPHTSAAIVGRLIGFTYAESGYAHPFWQAAKRRNCDGDEDGLMLLMETLLNFSMHYLPSKLGGKMDAPLVLSVRLDPLEVDGESHNVDYAARYPLSFYQDCAKFAKPGDIEKTMLLYKHMLNKPAQFEGCMFTHPTKNINYGPHKSAYTLFETMEDKIESQLWLARTILAVDAQDVARKVISSHFAPDVLGNIRSYATQGFRCIKCGEKFRRIPLTGVCTECGGKILMTVTAGGITKYLGKAIKMIQDFNLGAYTAQRWEIIQANVTSLTNNPRVKQKSIKAFFK